MREVQGGEVSQHLSTDQSTTNHGQHKCMTALTTVSVMPNNQHWFVHEKQNVINKDRSSKPLKHRKQVALGKTTKYYSRKLPFATANISREVQEKINVD